MPTGQSFPSSLSFIQFPVIMQKVKMLPCYFLPPAPDSWEKASIISPRGTKDSLPWSPCNSMGGGYELWFYIRIPLDPDQLEPSVVALTVARVPWGAHIFLFPFYCQFGHWYSLILKTQPEDFPKTLHPQCRGPRLNPWLGNWIPHTTAKTGAAK